MNKEIIKRKFQIIKIIFLYSILFNILIFKKDKKIFKLKLIIFRFFLNFT